MPRNPYTLTFRAHHRPRVDIKIDDRALNKSIDELSLQLEKLMVELDKQDLQNKF